MCCSKGTPLHILLKAYWSSIFITACLVSSHSEDGLQRRVCALLSLPWVCESMFVPAYKNSGFPSWLPALAQRLSFCYCEYLFVKPGLKCFLNSFTIDIMWFFRFPPWQLQTLCVLLQHLRSRQAVCHCWPSCVMVCVRHGVWACFPRRCRVQMRRLEQHQSGPSLFFYTTWGTRTRTSSVPLCCTHLCVFKQF